MPSKYWDVLQSSRHDNIDPTYWHSLGRCEGYADAMIDLQNLIVDWTNEAYYNRFQEDDRGNIKLCPSMWGWVESPILLLHNAKLSSRWQMLFHAIAGSRGWKSLTINSIEIPKLLMDELAKALKLKSEFDSSPYTITFNNNNFGRGRNRDGSSVIPQIIREGIYLQSISITNNIINSKVASSLSTVIADHAHLKNVELSDSGLGNNTTRNLSSILSSCHNIRLELLRLNNINLHERGVTVLSDFLASDPHLQALALDSNELDDNAAILFARSLGTNSRLRLLSLAENNFSDVACDAFATAIFDDSTLNALIDCNHTCTVTGISDEITNLQCSKETKKFRAIWSKGKETGLRHHLYDDLSLEEMPKLLSWIQHVPIDVCNPLYLMFAIIRSYWELPLLFSGRHQLEEVKLCLRDMVSIVSNEDCSQSFHQALLPPRKTSEYDVILPKTQRGLLLVISDVSYCKYFTAVDGYRRCKDRSKGVAELFTRVKLGDIVTAVNGMSTTDKSFHETAAMLKNINLPFSYIRLQSRKSFLRPYGIKAHTKYSDAYKISKSLQDQKKKVEMKYNKLGKSVITCMPNASNRLKRSLTREQIKMKLVVQQAQYKFAAAEQNRAQAWFWLTKMNSAFKKDFHSSYLDCQCGWATINCSKCGYIP